jgi:uncharacterized protein (DUF2384 family)
MRDKLKQQYQREMCQSQDVHEVVRAIYFLVDLENFLEAGAFQSWLEKPNSRLSGKSPVDLLQKGRWRRLADEVNDIKMDGFMAAVLPVCPPEGQAAIPEEIDPRTDPIAQCQVVRQKMKLAEGGGVPAEAPARLLGISELAVLERLRDGRLVSWGEGETIRFPAWQFEDAKVLAGVEAVLRVFRSRHEWVVMAFFLGKCHALDNRRPLDLIRSDETARVIEYVKTYEEKTRAERQLQDEYAIRTDEDMLRIPDMVKMRGWRGKRAIVRTLLLLAFFDRGLRSGVLIGWLERPNPRLNGDAPSNLIERGQWKIPGDWLDEMLSGDSILNPCAATKS